MNRRRLFRRLAPVVGLLALACPRAEQKPVSAPSPSRAHYSPTRFDYAAFGAGREGLPEPNYLPFMAQRFELPGSEQDVMLFCHWRPEQFPLRVRIEPPLIDEAVQDEFHPRHPSEYVAAVEAALSSWEEALPEIVSFQVLAGAESAGADLVIRIVGSEGPAPADGVQVLGITPVLRACRATGGDPASGRLDVEFDADDVEVYVADGHGMLPPDQVGRVAMHEIGHALGMRGHSPIPADLMYEVARDRRVDELSSEDRDSFRALYAQPNGTIFARVPRGAPPPRPLPTAPEGPVELAEEPWVDDHHGFAVRLALSWPAIAAPRGVVAIDGVPWDYEASFQVIARPYPTIESYLERHGSGHIGAGEVIEQGALRVAGREAFGMRVLQRGGTMIENHVFVATGDGRVLVVITDCATNLREGFDPWFLAMLESLEVRSAVRAGPPRGA